MKPGARKNSGTVEGSLDKDRTVQFLAESFIHRPLHDLLFLWVVVRSGEAREVFDLLKPCL